MKSLLLTIAMGTVMLNLLLLTHQSLEDDLKTLGKMQWNGSESKNDN